MSRRLIDRDTAREQVRQSRLLDVLTRKFRRPFAIEIARAMNEMADGFEVSGEFIAPRGHVEGIERAFEGMAVASALTFANRITAQGKAGGFDFEVKEEFAATMTRIALGYIMREAVRRRITRIADTTRAEVVAVISAGYDEGLGARAIASSIRDIIPGRSFDRGVRIARTETHGAANFGANEAARETGLPLKKEWLASADERTRQDHADASGQTVGMDEPFDVGGSQLMFPGDPDGPPEQVIQCRCGVGYIVVEN